MEVVIAHTPAAAGIIAADIVAQQITDRPASVLGLATGSSPLPLYRELIARHQAGLVSFANVTAFLLDEYVGLPADHPEAYRRFIERELTDHIDLPPQALFGPDGSSDSSDDLQDAGERYEAQITAAGGIDLQILGLGGDGHIGFNEPTSSLASRTRIKTLTDMTRADNARFFDDDIDAVPRHVLTQGIGTILDARHLVLVATGESKAEPVARTIEGPITSMVPASALQLHRHVTIIVDEAAAGSLTNVSYYRETYLNRPSWQRH